jgi:hypothetical protein
MLEIRNTFLVKRILVANLAVFALFSTYAQQQPLKTFSLKDAEEYALQNKSEAKNAQLGIDEAKARNWEIIATGLPVVSGSADYTYYFKRPESPALSKFFSDPKSTTNQIYGVLAQKYPAEIGPILAEAAKIQVLFPSFFPTVYKPEFKYQSCCLTVVTWSD